MPSPILKSGNDATVLGRMVIPVRPFIEVRRGRLIGLVYPDANVWRVHFPDEPPEITQLRVVHGGAWQTHVDEIVAGLVDHFRATGDRAALLTEFFPFGPRR